MQPQDTLRYRVQIPADRLADHMRYWLEATDRSGRRSSTPAIALLVNGDREPPRIEHQRVSHLAAGEGLRLVAHVSDPSGVRWVRVRYRGVNQHQDYRTMALLPSGEEGVYTARIPAGDIDPKWDFMYYLEAADEAGNARIWPDLETDTPYVVIHLDRERRAAGVRPVIP
jgi:hypothetical protein